MTASPRAERPTDTETVALIDAARSAVHIEFRAGDPDRRARVRAVMDRVGNLFGNR
ncbi:MAG: hypothetical protein ACRD0P_39385 [Stackebrandtia sp.]